MSINFPKVFTVAAEIQILHLFMVVFYIEYLIFSLLALRICAFYVRDPGKGWVILDEACHECFVASRVIVEALVVYEAALMCFLDLKPIAVFASINKLFLRGHRYIHHVVAAFTKIHGGASLIHRDNLLL